MGLFKRNRTIEQLETLSLDLIKSNPPRDLATQRQLIYEDFRGRHPQDLQPTIDTAVALHFLREHGNINGVIYVRKNSSLDHSIVDFLVESTRGVFAIQATSTESLVSQHLRRIGVLYRHQVDSVHIVMVHSRSQKGQERSTADYASDLSQRIYMSEPILVYEAQ